MPFPSVNSGGFHSFVAALGRSIGEKWDALFRGSLLRVTFFSGLILALLIGGGTAALYLVGGGSLRARGGEGDGSFYRLLRDYDRAAGHGGSESLDRELAKLEKRAGGVESWLSVLKRRRRLARLDSRYMPAYRQAARRARAAFPYSEPLAAVAAAALLQDAAISREAETELRACLPLFADSRLQTLRLSFHVLLGDLKNPVAAEAALPRDLTLLELGGSFSAAEKEILAGDLGILKLLNGNIAAAAAEIQAVLAAYSPRGDPERRDAAASPSDDFLRFAAEYHYDFGDLLRSAELFSWLPGEAALLRQADALHRAGYTENARTIWSMLAAGAPGSAARALYNLAITAENRAAAAVLLERLAALPGDSNLNSPDEAGRRYGLIRYSRFFDAPRALAILAPPGGPGRGPESGAVSALVELEILRRRTEVAGTGRLAAETWLLLGRYPEEESLFRWAAWLFDLQRNYAESDALLKTAARRRFEGQWFALHEALGLLREGNLDAAETILASIPAETASWTIVANRGRILEARRDPARALECYETAAALLEKKRATAETASRIQFRIAQCLASLGRPGESRRVLEYALDLNPDNLSARLELGRLGLPPGSAD